MQDGRKLNRSLVFIEGAIATFTIDNNVLKLTYIDTTTKYSEYSALNVALGLRPAPIQFRKR
ncbi:MAG: hypothetical protein ACRCR9_01670 [Chitinophagaceae bacterium]